MAFTEMAFNPTDGLLNTTSYPTQPADEAAARAQLQAPSNQIRDFINNTLLSELGSSEVGADGAGKIGSEAIDGVTGTTVQAKLVAIKALIDALSISASGLSAGVVETAFLADLAVTAAKLAADAVETLKIKDGAVTESKIAEEAITTTKIAPGAVTGYRMANDTITTTKIAPGAVTGYRIADGAVTPGKLDRAYLPLTGGSVSGELGVVGRIQGGSFETLNTLNIGGDWESGYIKTLNGCYIWVDSSDRLRIKHGAPTSDTDGTVVGTQS
jgi:hypothetical protein